MKKPGAGAGAAQKNQETEPLKKKQDPEPPKLGSSGSGSGSIWLIIQQTLKIISLFLMCLTIYIILRIKTKENLPTPQPCYNGCII